MPTPPQLVMRLNRYKSVAIKNEKRCNENLEMSRQACQYLLAIVCIFHDTRIVPTSLPTTKGLEGNFLPSR